MKKLVLTQDGLAASAQVMQILGELNRLMVQSLSQEEVAQLCHLLGKIEENLIRVAP